MYPHHIITKLLIIGHLEEEHGSKSELEVNKCKKQDESMYLNNLP